MFKVDGIFYSYVLKITHDGDAYYIHSHIAVMTISRHKIVKNLSCLEIKQVLFDHLVEKNYKIKYYVNEEIELPLGCTITDINGDVYSVEDLTSGKYLSRLIKIRETPVGKHLTISTMLMTIYDYDKNILGLSLFHNKISARLHLDNFMSLLNHNNTKSARNI